MKSNGGPFQTILDIIPNQLEPEPQALFDFYWRVKRKNLGRLSDTELLAQLNTLPEGLCIVNTRKHARGLGTGTVR